MTLHTVRQIGVREHTVAYAVENILRSQPQWPCPAVTGRITGEKTRTLDLAGLDRVFGSGP